MDYSEESLIEEIKNKKELRGISPKLIKDILLEKLKNKGKNLSQFINFSKFDKKIIIKEVRAELRLLHGRFNSHIEKRNEKKSLTIDEILETHNSTKERLADYNLIKDLIKKLNPKSILDLGCGLNPLAILDTIKSITYYASDINENDLALIDKYFKINNIEGKTFFYDLRKINSEKLPSADLCIIFKVLDIIEKKGHKLAEQIMLNVDSKYFLISFATRKLSNKPMNRPKRTWFEYLLKRLNYTYEILETSNEIIYIIKK